MFFNKETNSFCKIKKNESDVEISNHFFDEMIAEISNGKVIVAGEEGYPALIDAGTDEERYIKGLKEECFDLFQKLKSTDYQAIKYAEGELSEKDFAEIRILRRQWRARLSEIEELTGENYERNS